MSLEKARQHVKSGIARLDASKGRSNWLPMIDLDQLDMASGHACALAHVFGSYGRGVIVLYSYGPGDLLAYYDGFLEGAGATYSELHTAWVEAIQELRQNQVPVTVEEVQAVENLLFKEELVGV